MALNRLQVTIGTSATRFIATRAPSVQAIIEADDGNAGACFIGPSDVASTNGIRLNNSATTPGRLELGGFSEVHFDMSELYVAGTENDIVNVLYLT